MKYDRLSRDENVFYESVVGIQFQMICSNLQLAIDADSH